MGRVWLLLLPVIWLRFLFFTGFCKNISSRPAVVNVGSIFTFESTIGRVAKIAIAQAVKDVNRDSSILRGTKLVVTMRNSNCSGFLGMVEALQFMETDAVAIIGPLSSVSSHIISQVANELQVPLVSFGATDPTLSSLEFPYFVRATQSDLYQMKAVAEIVEHYAWKEVTAIYIDNDYGRSGISALNDQLAARRCKISYKAPIAPGPVSRSNIMDILVKVAMVEARVIILHATPNSGSLVFSVAHYLGMMGSGYVWIATDWLASLLDSVTVPSEMTESMQGVLVLRQHTADSDKKRAFSSRWNRLTGNSLGLSSYGFYAYDAVWILARAIDSFFNQGGVISFSNDTRINSVGSLHLDAMSIFNDGPLLLKNILDSNFTGLTGPIKFEPDKSITNPAFDVINVVGNGMRRIGYWSNYTGLSTMPPETLYSKPPNCSSSSQQLYSVIWPGETVTVPRGWVFPNNGKQLRIGVPNRVSFREFVSKVRGSDNLFKGFCIDVFVAAVNLLPYPVPYQFVSYGDGVQNPSYSELVNLITTDAAIGDIAIVTNRTRIVDFTQPYAASGLQSYFDAAIGDIAIVTNRTRIVDFTQPFAASGLVVVAPFQRLNTGGWAFLKPFSKEMWAVTALFCLVIGFVVWILEHRINDEFRGSPKQQITTILWFSLSTLFFAHRENTVSTLARSVLLIWLFVVLIINSSYTANLTSILTVQQLFSTIKGIDTLREGDDPIGYQVGSFAEHYLTDELGIAPSRLRALGSPEEYGKVLKDGPGKGGVAAIVDELPYVDLFLSSQCTYRVVGQQFTKSGWGFAFPRDSPLAIDLSTAILTLSENGDLQRIHDKWMKQSSCSLDGSELESDQLHLKSFWGLYLICGVACFLALFIYFLQILRQLKHSDPAGPPESVSGGSHSRRIQRILSLMDEKKDPSEKKKRRKVEIVEMDSERELELSRESKKRSVNIEELSK